MALTSIGTQKTPGRPIELTFDGERGLPSANQELLLIGHIGSASGTIAPYAVTTISNSADEVAASGECATKFGEGSELQKMVLAAVRANSGQGTFPQIKCVTLAYADTDFGTDDAALVAARNTKAEYIASCYDGQNSTLRDKLKAHCILVSGPHRVENNQFGSIGVVFNRSVTDPSTLDAFDTPFIMGVWLRDTGTGDDEPALSIGEMAAACASRAAGNLVPFNPLDDVTIQNVAAPLKTSDWPTRGAGLESETCLGRGWTPLFVKPNGEVAFVRTVTGRLSADGTGSPLVTAYYDIQDFNVLYFWRKTLYTRYAQPDFKRRKASASAAADIRSEAIRLAKLFETQGMFQAVDQLAKLFQVERNAQDRHRFDFFTPVNVIPGLHVIAGNIQATTQFDTITI